MWRFLAGILCPEVWGAFTRECKIRMPPLFSFHLCEKVRVRSISAGGAGRQGRKTSAAEEEKSDAAENAADAGEADKTQTPDNADILCT